MRKLFSLLVLVFCFVGCPIQDPITPPRPTPVVIDTDKCLEAEINLKALKCIPDGPFTTKGKSFTQVCEETQNAGVFFNPVCLSKVTACGDQVLACTGSK